MSRRRGSKRERAAAPKEQERSLEICGGLAAREKYLEPFIIAVLLAFGVYHSILYFGHQVVPNSDFSSFISVARELLSFRLPSSYKRAPVLGILQVILSYFMGGRHPDLTAGWLLNAILHPLNVVLLWLVGRRIVGKAAVWIAVVAIINPWIISYLRDPIAETTLLFFVLLTFYFIFRRSSWCYLFASITTMVRYEGAALILAAFLLDVIDHKDTSKRIRALVYAAAASVPLGLWMLGTVINWSAQGSTHYLKELGEQGPVSEVLVKYIELTWSVGFSYLFFLPPTTGKEAADMLTRISELFVAGSFVFGTVYGLYKRQWNILALLVFLVPYIIVHTLHSFVYPRFCLIISWIPLLICFYGLDSLWKLVNKNGRFPPVIIFTLQGILLAGAVVWLVSLIPYLPQIAPMSRRSVSMPYVGMGVIAAFFAAQRFIYGLRFCWRDLSVSALVCLIIVCSQFPLAYIVGNGEQEMEFKLLADWYIANAKPGEKMLTTMVGTVRIFVPERSDLLIHPGNIEADGPADFVRKCYDKDITYVVWDSRIGLHPSDRYYKLWGIDNIKMLARPQSIGPYEFITPIRVNNRQYLNIFRLQKPADGVMPGKS